MPGAVITAISKAGKPHHAHPP